MTTDDEAGDAESVDDTDEPVMLHGCVLTISHTQDVLHVSRGKLRDVVAALGKDGYHQ